MFKKDILLGKTVVVTGGGRGIGAAIACGYADAGAEVYIGSRTEEEIHHVVETIRATGKTAYGSVCDVTNFESLQAFFSLAAETMGGIDLLVVNAGINPEKETVEESSTELWKRTIDVNLIGAYYSVKAVIPYMKNRGGGKIITIGSGKGHRGSARGSAYACSKAGAWMLTKVLAEELADYNIAVNELIPGPTETSMNSGFGEKIDSVFTSGQEWVKKPEDIVPLAIFMAIQETTGPSHQSFSLAKRML